MPPDKTVRILYMEDDRSTGLLVRHLLQSRGYDVTVAPDGETGLQLYRDNAYDLLLLDHTMPGKQGLEVLEILSRDESAPPVIMITGSGDERIAASAIRLGASEYLVKDVHGKHLESLPAIIKRCLEQHRLRRAKLETEKALRESEERFRELAELLPQTIFEIDSAANITYVNRAAVDLLGYTAEELIGNGNSFRMFPPSEHTRLRRNIERVLAGKDLAGVEYVCLRRDGTSFPVIIHASRILREGVPVGLRGIVIDVTAQKEAERELRQHKEHLGELVRQRTIELEAANRQLRQKIVEHQEAEQARRKAEAELEQQRILSMHADRLRSLGEMSAGIAHELNQPLSGVRGIAEHLLIGLRRGWRVSRESLQEKLGLIVEQADRMTHIIEHVRMFAREAGKPETRPIQVNDAIRSAQDLVKQQMLNHGLVLTTELHEDVPLVEANPFSLEEVVLNLLSNARDAVEETTLAGLTSAAPAIVLRTFYAPDNDCLRPVRITVTDRGVGISPNMLTRIFDPFFTTKGPDRGTGLGLAISKAIVEEFGGRLTAESAPGTGTTLTVALPVAGVQKQVLPES